jgi:hypothetical protein
MAVTATTILLRADLSDPIRESYEITAARTGKTIEAVMSETLTRYAGLDSAKPVILTDLERQAIVGKNITTGSDVVRIVTRAVSISVNECEIPLSQYLLDRLKSRCIGMDFDAFLRKTIKNLLEEFAGLR